jgi:Uma2 family endonuclease
VSTTTVKGLSVETYEKMVRKEILPESNRFELIEGRIVEKMTRRGPHCGASERTWRLIDALLPAGWHVRIGQPVRIPSRKSEPEPDVSVARGSHKDYDDHHPGPGDVGLVVEITRTSAAKVQKLARMYAAGNIPLCWIIDVPRRCVYVSTGLAGDAYTSTLVLKETEVLDLVIDGQVVGQIPIADLLPR